MLVAMHMLERSPEVRVTVFDPAPLGSGIAYGTDNPGHLLNVPAARMSARPEDPDHFLAWLAAQSDWRPQAGITPRSFAPRRVYRAYLQDLLAPWPGRLTHVRQAVTALQPDAAGVRLSTANGDSLRFDAAVLATGNGAGPLAQPAGLAYWRHPSGFELPPAAPVAILGNGLSMVDSVIALLDAGHRGPITTISRHGLIPRPHAAGPHPELPLAPPANLRLATLAAWFRHLRREGRHDWRQAMELLRPQTQAIWLGLSEAEKRRFLRHARPWWDVHRHRMPPELHERMARAQAAGQWRIVAGSLTADRSRTAGIVEVRHRGSQRVEAIAAEHLIDCRGQGGGGGMAENPLLAGLVAAGLAQRGFAGLGLAVTADCAVIDAEGRASDRLHAVGPLTLGTFWEIIAIPDIRVQARDLATRLLAQG